MRNWALTEHGIVLQPSLSLEELQRDYPSATWSDLQDAFAFDIIEAARAEMPSTPEGKAAEEAIRVVQAAMVDAFANLSEALKTEPGERIARSDADVLEWHGVEDEREFSRRIYKDTDCGAWVKFICGGVHVGTIVEGSDAEFSEVLLYPFTESAWDNAIKHLEDQADEAWHAANDDDRAELYEDEGYPGEEAGT